MRDGATWARVVCLGVLCTLLLGCSRTRSVDPDWSDAASAEVSLPEELVREYAPRVWLHPDERDPPSDPMEFLRESSVWTSAGFLASAAALSGDDLRSLAEDAHLEHVAVPSRSVASALSAPALWRPGNPKVLAAVFGPPKQGIRRSLVEYWFHYPYSRATGWGLGNHQGDWEGYAVAVEWAEGPREWKHRMLGAYLAAHEGGRWSCASELETTDQGKPQVYSALGTHATYRAEGDHDGGWIRDRTGKGWAWDTWKTLRLLTAEPYYGFKGSWGARSGLERGLGLAFMSGPLAPGPGFKALGGSLRIVQEARRSLRCRAPEFSTFSRRTIQRKRAAADRFAATAMRATAASTGDVLPNAATDSGVRRTPSVR